MIDLTKILVAIIDLLALILTYKVIPILREKYNAQQLDKMRAAIRVAVYAAEQLYGAGQGDTKLEFVKQWLRDKGFDVDRVEIEAAVSEHINSGLHALDTVTHRDAAEKPPNAEA